MSTKNILKLARQIKKTGRLNKDDIDEAVEMFSEMEPGEKKARFGEVTDYNDMVTNKLKAGLGKLFGPAPDDLFRRPVRRILNDDRPTRRTFGDGTKPVLDSKGNIVKNLRQKAKHGGQFQEVDVIDLTTEMVIDE
tara:strand:+ start:169 stop:576 length:408 start_codon:yes stop_codon:yes gene_type:complete